jgi:hypothetical protein
MTFAVYIAVMFWALLRAVRHQGDDRVVLA